ncbi:hypothetical protein F5887DRAFT_262832 [Amanita rubescens]|nr:hypothetical protein F5887DRAFT_262832 [Amanita rubescens]
MSVLPLLLVPFRSLSSSPPHSRYMSSLPIDDNIFGHYSNNLSIDTLDLRKERKEPEHEFVILKMADTYYRVERRPSEGTGFNSKLHGCKAEDTITPLNSQAYRKVCGLTDCKIAQVFWGEPKPDLHTVFAFCNAIHKDSDAEKYTLAQFNCYFFARTLTLLISRHFLTGLYCRIGKPRNDFSSLPGPEIDAIMDDAMNSTLSLDFLASIHIVFDSDTKSRNYKDLREHILEMHKRHCKRVDQFGGNGNAVYDTLNKKTEEIWRCVPPVPISAKSRVDPDLALDSHATAPSDEKKLLARPKRGNNANLKTRQIRKAERLVEPTNDASLPSPATISAGLARREVMDPKLQLRLATGLDRGVHVLLLAVGIGIVILVVIVLNL